MVAEGAELLARLETLSIGPGQVGLCWLGQASFVLRTPRNTVLIDPFLTLNPQRLHPPPFAAEQARGVDLVLCTHEHIDHMDRAALPGIAAASPQARFVVPAPIVSMVTDLGIAAERVRGLEPEEHFEGASITVSAVPAKHGVTMADAYTFGRKESDGEVRFLGYVLEANGVVLYHAGDTILYDGMVDQLRPFHVDLALLPINGRSVEREERELVGNMNEREAAHLASAIGARMVIPMHHDMFAGNLGHPEYVVTVARHDYPELAVLVPARFQPFLYGAVR